MPTASDVVARHDEDHQRATFEHMVESFSKNYRPVNPNEAYYFDRDFYSLVRQIYRDAQQPLLDQLTKIISVLPPQFIVPRDHP
jgi:hypothetical protein